MLLPLSTDSLTSVAAHVAAILLLTVVSADGIVLIYYRRNLIKYGKLLFLLEPKQIIAFLYHFVIVVNDDHRVLALLLLESIWLKYVVGAHADDGGVANVRIDVTHCIAVYFFRGLLANIQKVKLRVHDIDALGAQRRCSVPHLGG